MTKRIQNKRRPSRLDCIERKCDRILSELLILRQQISNRPNLDNAIDRLHRAARNMRTECERERDAVRRMFAR